MFAPRSRRHSIMVGLVTAKTGLVVTLTLANRGWLEENDVKKISRPSRDQTGAVAESSESWNLAPVEVEGNGWTNTLVPSLPSGSEYASQRPSCENDAVAAVSEDTGSMCPNGATFLST